MSALKNASERNGPQRGLVFRQSVAVDESLTVPRVSAKYTGFADMPPVFATAYLVGLVETTCVDALRPYLAANEQTVGTHVDMSHIAATPVGMNVTAEIELVAVEGRKLTFKVACRDEMELICAGYHERMIVDRAKFMGRVAGKAASGFGK